MRELLRREFWNFLYSQGFPSSINDLAILLATRKVNVEGYRGKRLRLKSWSFVSGGEHDDDVALTRLLAEALGLKQGVDWDWGLEPDGYHFNIAFTHGDRIKELLRLLDLYNEASLVFLNASMKLASTDSLEGFDLQQVFAEEWKNLKDEKKRLETETIQELEKFFSKLEERLNG